MLVQICNLNRSVSCKIKIGVTVNVLIQFILRKTQGLMTKLNQRGDCWGISAMIL